jgi:hypothetical protein
MGNPSQPTRPRRVKGASPARSVRVSDEVWDPARRRAAYDDVSISHVINALLEGYAKGLLNLPKVQVTYQQPKQPATKE